MSDPRLLALRFLLEVDQGRHVDELSLTRSFPGLSPADRGLARALVYGCLRQLMLLDYTLSQHSSRPLSRLDSPILWLLRLGAYQISFLRVPEHAAVDTSVSLCRRVGFRSASGFVNAVLRNVIRRPVQPPAGDDAQSLSIRYSHPEWLVGRYLNRWGPETTRCFLEQNNQPARSVFWVNPRRGSRQALLDKLQELGLEGSLHPELANGVRVEAAAVSTLAKWTDWGFFMDEASQRIVHNRVPFEARSVGDLCSAPGGKTFLLEAQLSEGAILVAADISSRRLQQLRERAQKLGVRTLSPLQCDASNPPFRPASFDFLLLDVPCSGLGTIRSNPDIRWRVQESQLALYQQRQIDLLRASIQLLARNAVLTYSTCSTEPEENEEVLRNLLESGSIPVRLQKTTRNFPGESPGDSFFWAQLVRISEA